MAIVSDFDVHIPLCHKCSSAIKTTISGNVSQLAGCKDEPRIKNGSDARKFCPLITVDNSQQKSDNGPN